MRRLSSLILTLSVPVLLLVGPLLGADKKDDKDSSKDGNTEKMVQAGQVVGKIKNVYEDKKKLRIEVTVSVPKYNQGAAQAVAQAQAQYQQAMLRRDQNGMLNAQRQMAQNQAKIITYENKSQELEIGTTDDVVVRSQNPPEAFDDKGKIKKYTKKELDELKGDNKKLPGYKAEFGDLQTDFIIRLQLVKKKDAPKPARKEKGKDADVDVLSTNDPVASLIVILLNPNATGPGKMK